MGDTVFSFFPNFKPSELSSGTEQVSDTLHFDWIVSPKPRSIHLQKVTCAHPRSPKLWHTVELKLLWLPIGGLDAWSQPRQQLGASQSSPDSTTVIRKALRNQPGKPLETIVYGQASGKLDEDEYHYFYANFSIWVCPQRYLLYRVSI